MRNEGIQGPTNGLAQTEGDFGAAVDATTQTTAPAPTDRLSALQARIRNLQGKTANDQGRDLRPKAETEAQRDALRQEVNAFAETNLAGGGAADRTRDSADMQQPLRRLMSSNYADGKSDPAGADRPGGREISNAVVDQTEDQQNAEGLSDVFWLWGQFMDHDMDRVGTDLTQHMPIDIPEGDPTFDPEGDGGELDFTRSTGVDNSFGARQQVNQITAMIDGSNVYGSTPEKTADLRSFEGGKLKMGEDGAVLPYDQTGRFYDAGDVRVNENIALTSMHTLWAREHNRAADELAEANPEWDDQQLFEAAREDVTATLQAITYNEFLPTLLGEGALGDYEGHDPDADPQISNVFAGAAYRFGHSMVSDSLRMTFENGEGADIKLADAFFNPGMFGEMGMDAILRGASEQRAQELDENIVDSLRNLVLEAPGSPRLDLAALNIQRGRDHGLPTLNEAREAMGLEAIDSFDSPEWRDGVGAELAEVYDSPDDVDLWVGLLSERPAGDALVGETQRAILLEQFQATRDGDPNWYENTMTPEEIAEVNGTTLADVIERNSGVEVDGSAFYVAGFGPDAGGAPMPVEPDGGIGDGAGPIPFPDGPIPVEPDGGIGDGAGPIPFPDEPIPVEPDGGIGDGAGPIPFPDGPIPVEPDGGIGDGAGPIPPHGGY